MRDIIHITSSLFFLFFAINSFGQLKFNQTKTDSLYSNYPANMPGMSYMVFKNGKIIENQNFGLANLTNKEKATNNTNYRLASVTKQFTAVATLMLIEKNKLSFSTTLTDIFDDFPKYGKLITIQQLLTHTSGLLDYEVLQLIKQQDSTKFIPGSKYDYSNSAYAVLAQIIEKKTNKSYKEFVEIEIFKPLKMDNSLVYTKDSKIKNRAYGYAIKNDSILFSDQSITSSVQGDGGIYTSLKDYFKWDQALENNKLISPQLKNKAYSLQSKNLNSEWDYGYGWRIKLTGKTKIISHSGHTSGFTNYVVKIPSQKLTIVLFSNRKNDDTVIEIGNILLQKYTN